MPCTPNGRKSEKLPESNAVKAIATNMPRTAILMMTMIALARADSLAPRMSSSAHIATSTTAGRFRTPGFGSKGPAMIASGSRTCRTLASSSLRYPDHPTETAAVDTPYSRSRQAATPIATSSPSVA